MRRIVILADDSGRQISEWTKRFCAQHGLFPAVELHEDSKGFYDAVKKENPAGSLLRCRGWRDSMRRSICVLCVLTAV